MTECVTKLWVTKLCVTAAEVEEEKAAGDKIKNKNTTQNCGEKDGVERGA